MHATDGLGGSIIKGCVSRTFMGYYQTWALALFFQVPSLLFANFLSMDRYRSIAHFADFQVQSSLNRSKKNQWFALGKERLKARSLLKLQRFALMYV